MDQALPTCLSCSQGGSLLAVGFTDEVIRVFDLRVRNKKSKKLNSGTGASGGDSSSNSWQFELKTEGHSDMVRQIKLSPEGMVCLSAGSDGCFKVWDLSSRRCVQTYGGQGNENSSLNLRAG